MCAAFTLQKLNLCNDLLVTIIYFFVFRSLCIVSARDPLTFASELPVHIKSLRVSPCELLKIRRDLALPEDFTVNGVAQITLFDQPKLRTLRLPETRIVKVYDARSLVKIDAPEAREIHFITPIGSRLKLIRAPQQALETATLVGASPQLCKEAV